MIKPANDFILAAQQICKCIDVASAKQLLDECQTGIVIDVREPSEAEQACISGSINIPRGLLEMKIQSHCPEPSQLILIHCAAGGRASLAAARLHEMGYNNVYAVTAKFSDIKDSLK